MRTSAANIAMDSDLAMRRSEGAVVDPAMVVAPPLVYALRFWGAVSLALFISFWLQCENPAWAGTTAAIVCQPQLGASLRKGWYRMIGTVIGAAMIVVLTALFAQDRVAFLGLLAAWCALAAAGATILRNYASYSAALAGYTAALVAASMLGATGGVGPDVFLLAVDRATEISIGIICAVIVFAGTDQKAARRHLAASLADLAADITAAFLRMFQNVGMQSPSAENEMRDFVQRLAALDPVIDQVKGESSAMSRGTHVMQAAVSGLISALNGWREAAMHLSYLPVTVARQGADSMLRSIQPGLKPTGELDQTVEWVDHPEIPRSEFSSSARTLMALPAEAPSSRLLADETAKVLYGIASALDGVALLVDAPHGSPPRHRFSLHVPDWLPAFVNAARVFVMIVVLEMFWVVTAWPAGSATMLFAAIAVLLLSSRGDSAYEAAIILGIGAAGAVIGAGVIKFAVLPLFGSFAGLSFAIGLYFIPVSFASVYFKNKAVVGVLGAMLLVFMPLLAPANQMTYDTLQYYNLVLALLVACIVAAMSFSLFPPIPPALRARRLIVFANRDLRRLAVAKVPPVLQDWEDRTWARLAAMPDAALQQRGRLLVVLSVGNQIIHLRESVALLGLSETLDGALKAFAQGKYAVAVERLHQLDRDIIKLGETLQDDNTVLRARVRLNVLAELLSKREMDRDQELMA